MADVIEEAIINALPRVSNPGLPALPHPLRKSLFVIICLLTPFQNESESKITNVAGRLTPAIRVVVLNRILTLPDL
jgi:hypothetical protein